MSAQVLFVVGPARSGTSALARLLNSHSLIAIGMERYLKIFSKRFKDPVQCGPDLFTKERFFDFREDDTHTLPTLHEKQLAYYEEIAARFDSCRFVGDKLTHVVTDYVELVQRFQARLVFILRDPLRVAASWNERARLGNNWPVSHDYRAAVKVINSQNASILKAHRRLGDAVTLVEYDRIFAPDGTYLDALLAALGLARDESIDRRHRGMVKLSAEIASKPISLTDREARFVLKKIDDKLRAKMQQVAIA